MMKYRIYGLILILFIFLCVSTVNTSDNVTDDVVNSVDDNSLEHVEVLSTDTDDVLTSDSVHVKTFSEFENAVENVGGTIDVDK